MIPMKDYDRLYVKFLYYFNVIRDYYECHEVLEELWLEEGRNPLYQGLLQVAVGLYHHHNGNTSGSKKLLTLALEKLMAYPEEALGINLGRLIEDCHHYLKKLHCIETVPFKPYDLDIHIIDDNLQIRMNELKQNPPVNRKEEL